MTDDEYQPVVVSRRICAPAHDIFQVLANPVRHPEFDGSQSLRGAVSTAVISAVEDVFVMKMYFSHLGDYEMNNHVVEYEQDQRIGWEPEAGRGHPRAGTVVGASVELPAHPRWAGRDRRDGNYGCSRAPEEARAGMDNGKVWIEAMANTLERLDALCASQGHE